MVFSYRSVSGLACSTSGCYKFFGGTFSVKKLNYKSMHTFLIHSRASAVVLFQHLTSLPNYTQATAKKKDNQPFSINHTIVLFLSIVMPVL